MLSQLQTEVAYCQRRRNAVGPRWDMAPAGGEPFRRVPAGSSYPAPLVALHRAAAAPGRPRDAVHRRELRAGPS